MPQSDPTVRVISAANHPTQGVGRFRPFALRWVGPPRRLNVRSLMSIRGADRQTMLLASLVAFVVETRFERLEATTRSAHLLLYHVVRIRPCSHPSATGESRFVIATPRPASEIASLFSASVPETCVLLVHPNVPLLHRRAIELISSAGWSACSIGRGLSAALLPMPPHLRGRAAERWLTSQVEALAPGPVLLSEIDLLFEPTLELDPLRLAVRLSRVAKIVVAWPGDFDSAVLTYAVPGHGLYRSWTQPEPRVFRLS